MEKFEGLLNPIELQSAHASILERIIPPEGLLLPQDPILKQGTTGLKIHIFEFASTDDVDIPGAIAAVYPELAGVFPNVLVLKHRGDEPHRYFENMGEIGNQTVLNETRVDQRVLTSGLVPSALGLGRIEKHSNGMRLFPDSGDGSDTREVAMVMPYYDESTDFGKTLHARKDGEFRREIMDQAVALGFAFERAMPNQHRAEYSGLAGIQRLIKETFDRAQSWYGEQTGSSSISGGVELGEAEVAAESGELFQDSIDRLFADPEFKKYVDRERRIGGFVDVHGDLRPYDNANVVTTTRGRPLVVFRDPVRLYLKDEREWSNFHFTHRDFQLGLLMGRFYSEGHHDLISYGIEAFQRRVGERNRLVDGRISQLSKPEAQMKGLGICYGVFVEIVVAKGKMVRGENDGPPIVDYWRAVGELADRDFLSWKEGL
ncbi:hypothetical protein IH980_00360 [Patescibacteria group bacterium]|nr:hypothetical protein [Patescibacteria group bacterium]